MADKMTRLTVVARAEELQAFATSNEYKRLTRDQKKVMVKAVRKALKQYAMGATDGYLGVSP